MRAPRSARYATTITARPLPRSSSLRRGAARARLSGACAAVILLASACHDDPIEPSTSIVVATLNTHSFQEGERSLELLDEIGGGLAALDADLVGLQEVMSGTFWAYHFEGEVHDGAEIIRNALDDASGEHFDLARCGWAHWDDGEEMSNVLLSRFPILDASCHALRTTDFWPAPDEQRNALVARVDVPRVGPIQIVVTHTSGYGSVDTAPQIAEVRRAMVDRAVGDERLRLVVGDLNVDAGSADYDRWLDAEPFPLVDAFAEANPERFAEPTIVDGDERIDYVLLEESPAIEVEAERRFDGNVEANPPLPVVSDHYAIVAQITFR